MRRTNTWKQKSLIIRERANYLCEVCKDIGVYTYDNLEVHHIEKLKDRPDLLAEDDNLICLCVTHHKQADEGILTKKYLKKLVSKREDNPPCEQDEQ